MATYLGYTISRSELLPHVLRETSHDLWCRALVIVDILLGPASELDARWQRVESCPTLVEL